MKVLGSVLLLFVFLTSCKKTRLVKQYEVFNGKWTFTKANVKSTFTNHWTGETTVSYFDMDYTQVQDRFELEFIKSGKVKQIKNDQQLSKDRVVFKKFVESSGLFVIHLNNKKDHRMIGYIGNDSIVLSSLLHLPDSIRSESADLQYKTYSYLYVKKE